MVQTVHKWSLFVLFFPLLTLTGGFRPLPALPAPPHPFYVSVTEMEYNAAEKAIEISIKVFTDDFEKALVKAAGQPVDIYKPKDKALLEKQIADYIRKHLIIKIDGKAIPLEYVGYEIEEQSTYSYYQFTNQPKAPKKIEISNSVFFELYTNQISIMHVTVNGNRKSTKLDYPATEAGFEF